MEPDNYDEKLKLILYLLSREACSNAKFIFENRIYIPVGIVSYFKNRTINTKFEYYIDRQVFICITSGNLLFSRKISIDAENLIDYWNKQKVNINELKSLSIFLDDEY